MKRVRILVVVLVWMLMVPSAAMAGAPPVHNQATPGNWDELPLWLFYHDDAGSGGDAPNEPVPEIWIESGEIYEGTIAGLAFFDREDHYAFHGHPGDVIQATARGSAGCYEVTDDSGVRLDFACTTAGKDVLFPHGDDGTLIGEDIHVTLEAPGIYYFLYHTGWPDQYRFSIGVNEEAPEPGLMGHPLPPLPPL